MALFSDSGVDNANLDAGRALRVPLGAASPLWFAFASAASAGVAYWWMTRWTKPSNLEAFGEWFAPKGVALPKVAPAAVEPAIETQFAAALEPVTAAGDAVVEAIAEAAEPTVELAQQAADQIVEATAVVVDDLTRIVGIGPRLSERLGALGVKSFGELAAWSEQDLAKFDKELDLKGRAVRDAWIAQARRFAEAR